MAHVALPCRYTWSVCASIAVVISLPVLKAVMWIRQDDTQEMAGVHFAFSLQEEVFRDF